MIHPIEGARKVAKPMGLNIVARASVIETCAGPSGEISILDGGLPRVAGPSIIRLQKEEIFSRYYTSGKLD